MYRTIMVCCVLIAVIPGTFEQRYLDRLRQWIQPPTINYKDQLVKFNLTKQIHVHRHQHHHHHHRDNTTRVKPNHGEHHVKMVEHQEKYNRGRHQYRHHPHHHHHQGNRQRKIPPIQKNPLGNVINDYQLVTNSNDNTTTEQVTTPPTITTTNQTETPISTDKLPLVETGTNSTVGEQPPKGTTKENPHSHPQTPENSYQVTESAEDESKEDEIYEIAQKIKQNIEVVNKTGREVKTKGKPKIKVLFDLNDILK